MPPGKALFLTIRDVEVSTLEAPPFYGATEEEQRAQANWFADRIVDLSVTINGVPVPNLEDFRFTSPQFTFTAPTPWVFGDIGGTGTTVSDGYFLMLELPKGITLFITLERFDSQPENSAKRRSIFRTKRRSR